MYLYDGDKLEPIYTSDKVRRHREMALSLFKFAAEEGDDIAQYHLAMCYKEGKYIEKSFKKAVYWLKKSAKQDNPFAEEELEAIGKFKALFSKFSK